jgi:hypothetical protein
MHGHLHYFFLIADGSFLHILLCVPVPQIDKPWEDTSTQGRCVLDLFTNCAVRSTVPCCNLMEAYFCSANLITFDDHSCPLTVVSDHNEQYFWKL